MKQTKKKQETWLYFNAFVKKLWHESVTSLSKVQVNLPKNWYDMVLSVSDFFITWPYKINSLSRFIVLIRGWVILNTVFESCRGVHTPVRLSGNPLLSNGAGLLMWIRHSTRHCTIRHLFFNLIVPDIQIGQAQMYQVEEGHPPESVYGVCLVHQV